MKVLVVGGGGREDTLVWKILQSPLVEEVYCAPGNGGTAERAAINLPDIKANDINTLLKFALKKKIDLTVVGPEEPLTKGIVNDFRKLGLLIVGPTAEAALIEGSKIFAKELMLKYRIPTARHFGIYRDWVIAMQRVEALDKNEPIVIKADGLCGGKGVKICFTKVEAINRVTDLMKYKFLGSAGKEVLFEEYLEGEEASYIVLTDGKNVVPLASSQDHKYSHDGDKGEMTGGMGAFSPAPVVTKEVEEKILDQIIYPLINGMTKDGRPYQGVLYAGLMIKDGEPKVLEFNARLGDPETQPVFVRMKNDIVPILEACARGNLLGDSLEWDERPAVCVVMCAKGYPGTPEKWDEIEGLNRASLMDSIEIFHAGTLMISSDEFWTNSGRVLGVTGLGRNIPEAIAKTYAAVKRISWPGVHYRTDIGQKALKWLKK